MKGKVASVSRWALSLIVFLGICCVLHGSRAAAQPIELKLLQRTSLRQDPSPKSKVVGRLEKGAHLLGYSTAPGWIRVGSEDGVKGWVLRSAVAAR